MTGVDEAGMVDGAPMVRGARMKIAISATSDCRFIKYPRFKTEPALPRAAGPGTARLSRRRVSPAAGPDHVRLRARHPPRIERLVQRRVVHQLSLARDLPHRLAGLVAFLGDVG